MAWRSSEPTNARNIPVGANYIRQNWSAIQTVLTADRLNNSTPIPDYVVSGTDMWFYADSAPTGWTLQGSLGDTVLAIKGGSTYTTGAASAGTWTQPSHTLTVDEIPAHSHTYTAPNNPENKRRTNGSACVTGVTAGTSTSSVGGGNSHNHGTSWRPLARVGIIARKD